MKLVFSRKGFDASRRDGVPVGGGVPSPILPDGSLLSLPIPSPRDRPAYRDVSFQGRDLGGLVEDLTGGRVRRTDPLHLDPDLRADARPRPAGWRPAFGQVDAAQTHLEGQGVGPGDLFLFFGWFRQTVGVGSRLAYAAGAPDLHVLFGWLRVGEVYQPTRRPGRVPAWAGDHPHVAGAGHRAANNTLYVAAERLTLAGLTRDLPGGGVFPRLTPALRLTAPGATRSVWRLPPWLHPAGRRSALSCHEDPGRWTVGADHVLLRTVGRGQEFVLDCGHYPEAEGWLAGLFAEAVPAP